jgi:hypothetical protein
MYGLWWTLPLPLKSTPENLRTKQIPYFSKNIREKNPTFRSITGTLQALLFYAQKGKQTKMQPLLNEMLFVSKQGTQKIC